MNMIHKKALPYLLSFLILIVLVYYIYFGLINCSHNFWLDWIEEIVGIGCYP